MTGSSKACGWRTAGPARAPPPPGYPSVRDATRGATPTGPVSEVLRGARRPPTCRCVGLRRSAVPSGRSTLRRTRGLAAPSAALPTSGTRSCGASVSLAGPSTCQDACHHRRNPLPFLGLGHKLLFARLGDRVEPRTAVIFRDAPLRSNPASLLEAHQRRIDSPLIENDLVATDLFNPAGYAISME